VTESSPSPNRHAHFRKRAVRMSKTRALRKKQNVCQPSNAVALGAGRWYSAAVSSTTWQLLDLSCQSTRTMWSRRTSSSVMKTIAASGVMEVIALRHRRFSARGRGRGPRGNFYASKLEWMYDQDGKPSATTQWTMEVFRGTAEWEYGSYVGAAAQRTAISTARRPDRLGQAQDSASWKCYDQSKVQLRHLNQIVSDDGSGVCRFGFY